MQPGITSRILRSGCWKWQASRTVCTGVASHKALQILRASLRSGLVNMIPNWREAQGKAA